MSDDQAQQKTTQAPPQLVRLRGLAGKAARYDLEVMTGGGPLTAKHLRTIAAQLKLQATFLDEPEQPDAE